MKKFNLNMKTVGNFAKKSGKVALYGLATVMSYVSMKDVTEMVRYSGNVKYSDAINAIMESSMFGSDKNKIVAMLKKDGDADYYKAIIKVVKSNMFGSDKVKAIEYICDGYSSED